MKVIKFIAGLEASENDNGIIESKFLITYIVHL
jgi:hypothetical protein